MAKNKVTKTTEADIAAAAQAEMGKSKVNFES